MYLLIGDLHLSENAHDEYRFGIFDQIAKWQRQYAPDAASTFLAGDLTDNKDRHSATLVNRTIEGLMKLKPPVYILKGNHDYRDPDNPFFKFLNHFPGFAFVISPVVRDGVGLIPHVREQADFDDAVKLLTQHRVPNAFLCHNTFDGAIAETGAILSGLSASLVSQIKPPLGWYAGDVHRPQTQAGLTYLGCPYHVRFGDNFNPRCLLVTADGKRKNLHYSAPFKWSLTVRGPEDLKKHDMQPGDMVKLTVEVAREEAVDWKRIRQQVLDACREAQVSVHGVKLQVNTATVKRKRLKVEGQTLTVTDTYDQFCKAENVASQIREAGKKFLE